MQHYELEAAPSPDGLAYDGNQSAFYGDRISNFETTLSYEEEASEEVDRQASEAAALAQLDKAQAKPVAFAIKSNIHYDSSPEADCPAPGSAISFRTNDFMHIKEKYNDDWWIGRLIREHSAHGFIPSPMKLDSLRVRFAFQFNSLDDELGPENGEHADGAGARSTLGLGSVLLSKDKKKLFKKFEHPSPYDVVPTIRPAILIGPSLKGFEVTDMMQKAIFDFLKERFRDRIIITRVTADIGLAKQAEQANPIGVGGVGGVGGGGVRRQGLIDRSNNSRMISNLAEVTFEIERVFELARTMQLVVLDCDTINHPDQVVKTSLAPILIYLKVASPKVLQRLIKSRGRGQARQISAQMSAAERLNQLPNGAFDVVLDENQLDEACNHLANYLEKYWRAIHSQPSTVSNKSNQHNQNQSQGDNFADTHSTINRQTEKVSTHREAIYDGQQLGRLHQSIRSETSAEPALHGQHNYHHHHHHHHQMSLPDQYPASPPLELPPGPASAQPTDHNHYDYNHNYNYRYDY